MLRRRWARPGQSYYRSFATSAESKRAYELLENPRPEIHLASLLAPHQQRTARRMAAAPLGQRMLVNKCSRGSAGWSGGK